MTPAMFPNRLEELRGFLKKKLGLLWREKDFQAEHELDKQKEENRKGEKEQEQELALNRFALETFDTTEKWRLAAKDYALRESGQNIKFQLEERKVDLQGKKIDIDVAQLKSKEQINEARAQNRRVEIYLDAFLKNKTEFNI